MVKKDTTGKTGQYCRQTEQINVYTYLVMSILFCTFVIEIRNNTEPLEVAHDTNKVHTIMITTNQTNITFVNKMAAVMAAQAMQLLAIHYGYHCGFEYWTYDTGSSDHIRVSIFTKVKDLEIPNGYHFSEQEQFYLEDSKVWVHQFAFKY